MPVYTFSKPGIEKPDAFHQLMVAVPYYDGWSYDSGILNVITLQELSPAQYTALQTTVENYTDPAVYLILDSTVPDTVRSATTNATSPTIVQTFIYSNTNIQGMGVFNAIKSVLEYATQDVSEWVDFTGTLTVGFEIYCYTRKIVIHSTTLDITSVANEWKQAALDGHTGPAFVYRTYQVEGLRGVVANHDCLWNYILHVSDPKLYVTVHAKQMLYYQVYE